MILSICKKELKQYFRNPTTYAVIGLFSLVVGWLFFNLLVNFVENIQKLPLSQRHEFDFANSVIISFFGNVNFMLMFLTPIMAMKTFSEEYRQGTIELYSASVLSDFQVVLGKYIGLCVQGAFLLSTTFVFPIVIGNIDLSDTTFIFTGYLAIFFNYCTFAAFGMLASSFTKNQILSALLAFILTLFIWLMSWFSQMSSNYIFTQILNYFSIVFHFEKLTKGIVSISDLSFYFSLIFIGVYLTKKRIESRGW